MLGRAEEYSLKGGWYVRRIVNKMRFGNSISPTVELPVEEDGENYEIIEDYKRDGIPDPDAEYNGRTVY